MLQLDLSEFERRKPGMVSGEKMTVSWYGGVVTIDTRPRFVGDTIYFGASIDGGAFEPCTALTVHDDKRLALAKHLSGAQEGNQELSEWLSARQ